MEEHARPANCLSSAGMTDASETRSGPDGMRCMQHGLEHVARRLGRGRWHGRHSS